MNDKLLIEMIMKNGESILSEDGNYVLFRFIQDLITSPEVDKVKEDLDEDYNCIATYTEDGKTVYVFAEDGDYYAEVNDLHNEEVPDFHNDLIKSLIREVGNE